MKKLISLCVCFAMIFGACFISGITERALGGKSSGESTKIKTKDEFLDLMQSASTVISQIASQSSTFSTALAKENNSTVVAVNKSKDNFLGTDISYSGMTIYGTTSSSNKYEIDRREDFSNDESLYGVQYADVKENFEDSYTMYLTDNAVLLTMSSVTNYDVEIETATIKYVQKEVYSGGSYGIYNVPVRDKVEKSSYITDIEMEMKLYMDKDDIYFMIDKYYSHTKNRLLTDSKAIEKAEESAKEAQEAMNLFAGKWINFKDLGEDEFDDIIYEFMASCFIDMQKNLEYDSQYFANNAEKSFIKTYNTYTLKSSDFEHYVKENDLAYGEEYDDFIIIGYADLEDIEGYLTIDLSFAQKPRMIEKISGIYNNEKEGIVFQTKTYFNLSFANIDNTEIVKPQNVITLEDLEEIFD